MGSGDCFRSLINLRKVKAGRSKKAKVHSTSEKANGSKTQDEGESSSHVIANDAPERNFDAPRSYLADQHLAARQIQTAFRAYRAGKSADRMKGDVRFNVLIQGNDPEKQTSTALSYIHSWSNIQAQIRARRYHMVTEGRIKQKKLESQLKLEAKLHELEAEWCGGSETMEEILSRIQQREEAAIKRERAMAYAFSHQWRANATQFLGQAYYSLGKEDWGWSWKERWIAARPWEIRVHSHPSKLKRGHGHSRQASTSDIKIPIPSTFALSNGDGNSKIKKLPNPIVEEIAGEASPKHVLSSSP
ncbi:hypothetical protein K2173_016821 [Erythroxylum novogranatense]|uniref:Protein IQ-DOMAIN 1 n=1 Tax=Erythroxylum novogranatense TaxID=1862640 RepID=A0AAV8SS55_9ROSI|nr:hypothetical protein K2173_016821 [Erythroxylum novogranatense]